MSKLKGISNFVSRFYGAFIGLIVLFGIIALVFFFTFPFKVAEIKSITVMNEVQAGGQIVYNVDYCRYVGKGIPIETQRFLVPEDRTLTNAIELSGSPNSETVDGTTGCRSTADKTAEYPNGQPIKLPVDVSTPAGRYQVLLKLRYCIFPGRCIPVEGRSDFFEVTKPSVANQLSIINEQLRSLLLVTPEYGSVGSVAPQNTLPEPVMPNTQATPQSTPTPQQGVGQSLTNGIINNTLDTVKNVTTMLGL